MMLPNVKSISAALHFHATQTPHMTYLITDARKYSYQEINHLVDSVCAKYKELGLQPGNILSAIIKNSVEYVLLYLASLRLGCVFNPYPYTLASQDVLRYLVNVQPKLVLCEERHYADLKSKYDGAVLLIDGKFISQLPSTEKISDFIPDEQSPACIYYSSGTTGNPKGVIFSHKNMMANISSIVRGFKHNQNSIHLMILPLGHTASINYSFLPSTLCGGSLVIAESFWKIRNKFWQIIKEHNVTYVEVVPSVLFALLNTPYKSEEYADIKSLPYIGCGSSTLPKESQIAFEKKYGLKVANLYGLSETGPTHYDPVLNPGWQPGSCGFPLDVNQQHVVDDNGSVLTRGKIGEIVLKGDNIFIGYHNNPDLYNTVVKDGWFYTGDLGYIDETGKLFFTGRKKDLIIKGGVNISPDEIDEFIYRIEGVKEASTVGITDAYLGEKIVSNIIVKEGHSLTQEEVLSFCRENLSRDKVPDTIHFVSVIPKGHSGKILRREIREELSLSRELAAAMDAAKEMGVVQMKKFRKDIHIIRKAPKEFVSEVDMACQQLCQEILTKKFSYPVISEETREGQIPEGRCWLVDPMDGTHNFIAGLPEFGISIALVENNQFLLGVIYLPYFDELYHGIHGQGAFLNGEKITVSSNSDLEKSMVTYDNQFHSTPQVLKNYQKVMAACFTTRILGSAVYDLCLVARGLIDARIWNSTKMFDFAAGMVIVQEAGGKVTDFDGKDVHPLTKEVIASNEVVHSRLLQIISS
jgi:acyl-CoA synthetase (AMP-forming)/AMP-acid ligase II/fructose-1,6-bisphosphatase/inositol monophosphatase family enzyme